MKNFILVSNEFGFPLYIGADGLAADKITDAMVFDFDVDNQTIKKDYWSALTGYTLNIIAI